MSTRPVRSRADNEGGGDFRPLMVLLRKQVDAVRSLQDAAREKQGAILDRDHEKIESASARESEILSRLQTLEERRSTWVSKWASTRSISKEITLRELIGSVLESDPATAHEIGLLADALNQALDDLNDLNQQNAGLLYHSLAYTQMMLGALTDTDPRSGTYGPARGAAEKSPAKSKAIVDWRA